MDTNTVLPGLQAGLSTPYTSTEIVLSWTCKNLFNQCKSNVVTAAESLCCAMACFERNLHTQISSGDSILSTIFCRDHIWTLPFCSMIHYHITIGNDVARDVHCEIIMGHDVAMGTCHDVTMHTDVTRTLIYVLLCPIMIFLFS